MNFIILLKNEDCVAFYSNDESGVLKSALSIPVLFQINHEIYFRNGLF